MKGLKIVLTTVFTAVTLFFILCPIVNNLSAKWVMEDIDSIPLPENTQAVERYSRAGKLVGNGNGMQFFGAILIESELPLEELDTYYSSYREAPWDYIVEAQRTQRIDVIEHGSFSFETDVSIGEFYIVYSWGDGISPFQDCDLRGH